MAVSYTKHLHDGDHIELAKATTEAGTMVVFGTGLTGVALTSTNADGNITIDTKGVYKLSVKGHNGTSNTAVNIGDKVYFTSGEAFLDVDPAAVHFGYALEGVTSGSTTTVKVKLK